MTLWEEERTVKYGPCENVWSRSLGEKGADMQKGVRGCRAVPTVSHVL